MVVNLEKILKLVQQYTIRYLCDIGMVVGNRIQVCAIAAQTCQIMIDYIFFNGVGIQN